MRSWSARAVSVFVGAAAFLASFAGYWFVATAQVGQYTSESLITFTVRPERTTSGTTVTTVAARYAILAGSDYVTHLVADDLDISPTVVASSLSAEIDTGTVNLRVRSTNEDPVLAQAMAFRASDLVIGAAADDRVLQAELVLPASTVSLPGRGAQLRVVGSGAVVATAVGVLAGVASYRSVRRWRGLHSADRDANQPMPEMTK